MESTEKLKEFISYGIIGAICAVFDFALLYTLTRYANFNYLISSAISFSMGAVLNYVLCTKWVFLDRPISRKSIEFGGYTLVSIIGLLINLFLIFLFTRLFFFHYMISKVIATGITFFWNYGGRKFLLHSSVSVNFVKTNLKSNQYFKHD